MATLNGSTPNLNPTSPKVVAGGQWAAYATFILTILGTVTPGQLSFLGVYAPLVYGLIIGISYAVGAWRKEDPLRTAGAATIAAKQVPTSQLTVIGAHQAAVVDPNVPALPAPPAPTEG